MFRKVFPKEQKGKTSQEGPDNQAAPGITQPATQHPISHQPLSSTGPSRLSTRPTTIKKFPRSSIRILGHRKTVTVPLHLNILRERVTRRHPPPSSTPARTAAQASPLSATAPAARTASSGSRCSVKVAAVPYIFRNASPAQPASSTPFAPSKSPRSASRSRARERLRARTTLGPRSTWSFFSRNRGWVHSAAVVGAKYESPPRRQCRHEKGAKRMLPVPRAKDCPKLCVPAVHQSSVDVGNQLPNAGQKGR